MTSAHEGADPEVRRLIARLEDKGPDATPGELRDAFLIFSREMEGDRSALPVIARVYDTTLPGPAGAVPVRVYEPSDQPAETADCFVFLHGGGWAIGDLDTGDLGARALAAELGIRVVSVHYRLAPEHPFPAPYEDCLSVLRSVRESTTGSVFIGGESAGGNLSAALAIACRDEGVRLAGQVLINPAVDLRMDTPSHARLGSSEGVTTEAARMFVRWYAGNTDIADPRLSPIRADSLAGVAPCLMVTAEYDPLLDDGVLYAQRLVEAGVPVVYLPMPRMMHAWWTLLVASGGARGNLRTMMALTRAFVAAFR